MSSTRRQIPIVAAVALALLAAMVSALPAAASSYSIAFSTSAKRTNPAPLDGATVSGNIYPFLSPGTDVVSTSWWLDDPQMLGTPVRTDTTAPFDYGHGSTSHSAAALDTARLLDGQHTITSKVATTAGAESVMTATFTTANGVSALLVATPSAVELTAVENSGTAMATVQVSASDGTTPLDFTATSGATWLTVSPGSATTPAGLTLTADVNSLLVGVYETTVTLRSGTLPSLRIPVKLTVTTPSGTLFQVVYSLQPKRTSPQPLPGATVTGVIYPFLSPSTDVASTSWWLDDPELAGTPVRTDTTSPFDYAPGSTTSAAAALDTTAIPDGQHTISVRVTSASGAQEVRHAQFMTSNGTNTLVLNPSNLTVESPDGAPSTHAVSLGATTAGTVVTLTSDAPWLRVPASTVTAPASLTVTVDPNGLTIGQWTARLTAMAPGAFTATLTVMLTVGDPGGCSPIACELIKVATPYNLNFRYDSSSIIDSRGIGTGFTTLLPKGDGSGYRRSLLAVSTENGTMAVTGTPGSFKGAENSQENALGVGFDGPSAVSVISATVVGLPVTSRKYEQAGVWFGYDQDHVDRVALVSTPDGWRAEHVLEVGGVEVSRRNSGYLNIPSDVPVELSIGVNPTTRKVTGHYKIGDAGVATIGSFSTPGEFFSFDGAGIDPRVGTRSFGGLFASQRQAAAPPVFHFSAFNLTGARDVTNSVDFPFTRTSVDVPFPTSMAYGPDGKLYVLSMFGKVHVVTFNADGTPAGTQVFSPIGQRLALGLTIDPASTADNVILWVGHSSPSADAGEADSGKVTRISGSDLSQVTHVITGLPRSIANHGTNNLHFGTDGRLYIAQGGNTGAGAPNTANTEFGERGEQKLSAALLVADVRAAGFNGNCAHPTDIYLSGDCDVSVFASGLRNTYDFVFHSNGRIYGPDNGLGVVGSYPPSPTAPCPGMGDTRSWTVGGNNPGNQNDSLNLIEQGGYYGHPNQVRNECVFKDGHYQAVQPLPNYRAPILDLGPNRSANGIVEFTGNAFCGSLQGNLLITNYSVGDDITAVRLASDGRSAVGARSIAGGFKDPLPITTLPAGRIAVGEFGGGKVTVLAPREIGCWDTAAALPEQLLDAGGAVLGNSLYVVGGKGPGGHTSRVYRYDGTSRTWSRIADLPGPAVENPAVVATSDRLLVFGGSTAAFEGAVATAWSYEPATNAWTALAPMPTARGGATAQLVSGQVVVAGGMTADGASTKVVEILDLTTGAWSAGPVMTTARDNPSSAVVNGVVYVFGGRTRLVSGQVTEPTLATAEALDLSTGTWLTRAAMPTGRRTSATAVVDGKAVVVGGEAAPDGSAFDVVEQYDPTTDTWQTLRRIPVGRHGAVAGVLDGQLHVVGGGPIAGLSFTDAHHLLSLPGAAG